MIVLVGGEKGGTGKTTLATNLAALRAAAGRDVLLVDTDRQGSASFWGAVRDEAAGEGAALAAVPCVQVFGKGVARQLADLAGRYDDVVVDAGGRDSVELRSAMVGAERLYVPVQASQFDVWTLEQMDELVSQAQAINPDLEAGVVINRASTHPRVREADEARGQALAPHAARAAEKLRREGLVAGWIEAFVTTKRVEAGPQRSGCWSETLTEATADSTALVAASRRCLERAYVERDARGVPDLNECGCDAVGDPASGPELRGLFPASGVRRAIKHSDSAAARQRRQPFYAANRRYGRRAFLVARQGCRSTLSRTQAADGAVAKEMWRERMSPPVHVAAGRVGGRAGVPHRRC